MKFFYHRAKSYASSLFLLALTSMVTSCIDVNNDFDLEDVDGKVQIGTNGSMFTIPTSDVCPIFLKDILEVDKYESLKTEPAGDGKQMYVFEGEGEDEVELVMAGGFEQEVEEIIIRSLGEVDLMDMPEWLKSGTVLDVVNPVIALEVENDVPVGLEASVTLDAYVDGEPAATVPLNNLKIKAAPRNGTSKTQIVICNDVNDAYVPMQYRAYEFCKADLSRLLRVEHNGKKVMPEKIKLSYNSIKIVDSELDKFEFSRGFLSFDYNVYAPLRPGKDFLFTYDEEQVDGWASDLKDIDSETSRINALQLTAMIDSNLPIGLELQVIPVDEEGNALKGLSVPPVMINAGAKAQSLKLELKADKGYAINDFVGKNAKQAIDGLKFSVMFKGCSATDGLPLFTDASIHIYQISAGLMGSVVIDLD